jgi:lysophospholipase L1-like esterase
VAALVVSGLVLALVAGGRPAATAQEPDLVYVALGDSFTSGPLVLPHDSSRVPEDCGQSIFNYPHLVAASLGVTELRDVSCGSAQIRHFYEPQTGLPLGGVNDPQLDVLTPDVDIVTVGISGNDVGFVSLALGCIRLVGPPVEEPCRPDDLADDPIPARTAAAAIDLAAALQDIQERAPDAAVYVVSYPASLPDTGVACWPYVPILPEDMPYLLQRYQEMNAMLEQVAAANGATYIDIYTPSIGHDACQLPGIAWVNGFVVVPPSYPAHPNQLGLAASARVVASTIAADLVGAPSDPPDAAPVLPATPVAPAAPAVDRSPPTAASVDRTGALPATGGASRPALAVALLLGAAAVARLRRAGGTP